jgi:hypothetical protein
MPLTQLENELRLKARALIDEGKLPARSPERTWGGYGTAQSCSLCGQEIGSGDVEYEVRDNAARDYRFHFMCHAAWQFECARREHLDSLANTPHS